MERKYGLEHSRAERHRSQINDSSCVAIARADDSQTDDLPAFVHGIPDRATIDLVSKFVYAAE